MGKLKEDKDGFLIVSPLPKKEQERRQLAAQRLRERFLSKACEITSLKNSAKNVANYSPNTLYHEIDQKKGFDFWMSLQKTAVLLDE